MDAQPHKMIERFRIRKLLVQHSRGCDRAETYFIAVARDTTRDDTPMCNQMGGRHVDRIGAEPDDAAARVAQTG